MKPRSTATIGPVLLVLAATLTAACNGGKPRSDALPARTAADRPNLLLVSIDTLRADRLSAYGYSRPTSPELDRFAAEAVLFERFYYNGGGTLPSHMSLFTSLSPVTHGIGPESPKTLEPERQTLAESLSSSGYSTAGFTDGGWMAGKFGFTQGFDRYEEDGHGLSTAIPRGLAWLDGLGAGQPFFLFLHTYDVHSAWKELPYDCPGDAELHFAGAPPAGYSPCRNGLCASRALFEVNDAVKRGSELSQVYRPQDVDYISALYDGCVRWADQRIGELFDELRSRPGLWENTLVVVLSDHGEEFGEHGRLLHDQGGYEELARIPLLIKPPGPTQPGRSVAGLAAMVDVLPTLLDLLEIPIPDVAQGRTLRDSMTTGRTRRPSLHMYSVFRTDRWKYFSDEHLLFDLADDPAETRNLYAGNTATVANLEMTVRHLIEVDFRAARDFAATGATPGSATLTSEEIERLRSLGYLR